MQRVLCVCVRDEKSWNIELNETKSQYLKAQICAKTNELVKTPILKLRLDCFYPNLSKCGTRVKEAQSLKLLLCTNMNNKQ